MSGSREYNDRKTVRYLLQCLRPTTVIHGDCRGLDTLADSEARKLGMDVEKYPADWVGLGLGAGPIRNAHMVTMARPDVVLAFPGRKGTEDLIRKAKTAGVVVLRVDQELANVTARR